MWGHTPLNGAGLRVYPLAHESPKSLTASPLLLLPPPPLLLRASRANCRLYGSSTVLAVLLPPPLPPTLALAACKVNGLPAAVPCSSLGIIC